MSRLGYSVLQFIQRVKRRPSDGSDPNLLEHLERIARESWDGAFVALHAPMAPETWEAQAIMPGAQAESQSVPLKFPQPIEVLGMMPTIVSMTPAAGQIATNDDVLLSIVTNRKTILSASETSASVTGGAADEGFVTASAYSVSLPRLVGKRFRDPQPSIAFKWRWKQGGGIFPDHFVAVAVFARFI